jgi:purine nucleosidase
MAFQLGVRTVRVWVILLTAGLLALTSLHTNLAAEAESGGERRAVLLDTDFGSQVDDAFALALLIASPEIELAAVTTSGGDTENRAWMACRLLSMVERGQTPVAWGRDPQPEGKVTELYQYRYHPAVLFGRTAKPVDDDAAELLYKQLRERKGGTAIVALGPLTNVARLLEQHADCKPWIGGIVTEESQLARDVKAAQVVFRSGVPLILVPTGETKDFALTPDLRGKLLERQTMLVQQLEALRQASGEEKPSLAAVIPAAIVIDPSLAKLDRKHAGVAPRGRLIEQGTGLIEVRIAKQIDREGIEKLLADRLTAFGKTVRPRELKNESRLIERGKLPTRVHAFEDFESDVERRWWLVGRAVDDDSGRSRRAMQSVLTLDFDDKQGDLATLYSAVVFNPVPGPPMGPRTRLAFRYRLEGTDELRVQLYSLSNGYHRYLSLKGLPNGKWQSAAVDMTHLRRPDGSGGALAADERIDDIQFYADPQATIWIDDIVLYEAANDEEARAFPERIVFTGWFDTGKESEWPGDYEIVPHEPPLTWKAAKSIARREDGERQWLRISFRGERPVGDTTHLRFKARITGGDSMDLTLRHAKGEKSASVTLGDLKPGEWTELEAEFDTHGFGVADELVIALPRGAEALIDDVLLYERASE